VKGATRLVRSVTGRVTGTPYGYRDGVRRFGADELHGMAGRFAGHVLGSGAIPGDRIVLVVDSLAPQAAGAVIAASWGALGSGLVPVLINGALPDSQRVQLIEDADSDHVFHSSALEQVIDTTSRATEIGPPGSRPMHYTSGTTGQPKGVWAGLLSAAEAAALWSDERDQWSITDQDTYLLHGHLAHSAPLRFGLTTALAGGSVVCPGPFDAATIAEALRIYHPTIGFVVPTHLRRLHALRDLPASTYRLLAHAGEPCPTPIREQVFQWAGPEHVWEFYGSTEGQFTAIRGTEWLDHPHSVGRARPGRKLRIEDDRIWLTGPTYTRFEYWRDPVKTAQTQHIRDGHTWFTAGDSGHIDSEGYLFLTGRREDLIITGGMNVYPAQVEALIGTLPGVDEVAVYGLPSDEWGEAVCLAYAGSVTEDSLTPLLREILAPHQRPKKIQRVTALPRNASGKVDRRLLASEA
jgi:long-chain acyl-CoA synthetase